MHGKFSCFITSSLEAPRGDQLMCPEWELIQGKLSLLPLEDDTLQMISGGGGREMALLRLCSSNLRTETFLS